MNTQPAMFMSFETPDLRGAGDTGKHADGLGREGAKSLPGRSPQQGEKPRILAVDDDPINLKLLSALLCRDCETDLTQDAQTALALFARGGHSLVFMDLHMPGTDGFDCALMLRRLELEKGWPRLPILALTADNTRQAADMALRCGMDGVVLKPLLHKALLSEIGKWCAKTAAGEPALKKEKTAPAAPPSL